MPDSNQIEASVVIPTYGHSDQLRRLLASLEQQEQAPPYEVLVVDDCSPDDTEEVVRAWIELPHPFTKRYLRMPKNGGPAKARNAGAREARGRIVAFTDTDCVVDSAWLRKLTAGIDEDRRIVGVGGAVRPLNPEGLISRYFTEYHILEPHPYMVYLVSANCCFLREPLLHTGGFDEDIPVPGGEDIGICIELYRQGWRFAFEPEAFIQHDYRESVTNYCKTWWRYGFGCGYVSEKHLGGQKPPSADNLPSAETGWDPNPLHITATPYEWLRGEMHEARVSATEKFGSRIVGIKFALLRLGQLLIHKYGWRRGVADFHRRQAQ